MLVFTYRYMSTSECGKPDLVRRVNPPDFENSYRLVCFILFYFYCGKSKLKNQKQVDQGTHTELTLWKIEA